MLTEVTQEKITDKAVVMEFSQTTQLRDRLTCILEEHNLSQESIDAVVAHSLATVLVQNFCISAQESYKHPYLSVSNSSIASLKGIVEPLCQWFISSHAIVDKLYKQATNGDMLVTVRVTGARIVFLVSPGQRRLY